jgi:hypothetical protein
MPTCWSCGHKWKEINNYPCGPCEWECPKCKVEASPCCGAKIYYEECEESEWGCETCDYCGNAKCTECNEHCHCGGCI